VFTRQNPERKLRLRLDIQPSDHFMACVVVVFVVVVVVVFVVVVVVAVVVVEVVVVVVTTVNILALDLKFVTNFTYFILLINLCCTVNFINYP